MKLSNQQQQSHNRRGAILTMELILVLPIFLLLLFAVVEFSLLTQAQTRISDAAHAGVRKICLGNPSETTTRHVVEQILGPKMAQGANIEVADQLKAGEQVRVRVLVPMQNAAPDLLWMTGFSVRNRVLVANVTMIREHDIPDARLDQL